MAQHDYVIDNQTAPNFRSDLNNALLAIASNNSGSSAPSTTYANMMWYDTTNNILKMRNEANDAWINIGTLNQTTDVFEVANLQTLSQATWEAGTSTTEAIVSPAKVKAAIDAIQYKPFAEAYVTYSGTTPTMVAEYGMATVSRPGAGDTAFTFDTAQPDTNYVIESHMQSVLNTTDARYQYWVLAKSTTGFTVRWRFTTLVATDLAISVVCKRLV